MNEKKTYEAPAIEEQSINDFVVLAGSSIDRIDSLGAVNDDQGDL